MAMIRVSQMKPRTPSTVQPFVDLMLGGMVSIQLPPVMSSMEPR